MLNCSPGILQGENSRNDMNFNYMFSKTNMCLNLILYGMYMHLYSSCKYSSDNIIHTIY